MEDVTNYETEVLKRIAPEAIMVNSAEGLRVEGGHAARAPADYQNPEELYN